MKLHQSQQGGQVDVIYLLRDELLTARELAEQLQSLALARHFAAWLHLLRGEPQTSQARAETAIALSHEQGFPSVLEAGMFL